MKTLKSILLGTFIAVGGIALAMNAKTQESICSERGHDGYTTSLPGNPTPTFNPLVDPIPSGWTNEGAYQVGFECEQSNDLCHWAYKPGEGSNPGEWIRCNGNFKNLKQ